MMLPLLLSPLGRWAAAALAAVAIVTGAFAYGHHKGAVSADARWQAAMAAEQTRQAAVRAKALDAAVTRELARAAENDALQKEIDTYEHDLAARPGCVLGRDDVDRLRKLQGDAAR